MVFVHRFTMYTAKIPRNTLRWTNWQHDIHNGRKLTRSAVLIRLTHMQSQSLTIKLRSKTEAAHKLCAASVALQPFRGSLPHRVKL